MSFVLVQIPVVSVLIDEARNPDRDQTIILEHLIRYFSKMHTLPAIGISIDRGVATVVRGHKYLLAARALGRSTIRAVVEGNPSTADLEALSAQTGATLLDWETIKAAEELVPMWKGWSVFFFARPLTSEEKTAFDSAVASLFPDDNIHVTHEDSGPLAEFEATVPVTNEDWYRESLGTFMTFSQRWVPIVSFQGSRFGPWP